MARARSLALSTAVLLVLGVVGWSVTQELIRDPVIIEPLAVPESLAKAGWTGEVLARQIRDGVREINEGAKTRRLRADYLFDREQLDIVLPGASLSIRTLVRSSGVFSTVRRDASAVRWSNWTTGNAKPPAVGQRPPESATGSSAG